MNYTVEQTANALNISTRTLYRYDKSGIFVALRHPTGRMYYTQEMINDYVSGEYNPDNKSKYINPIRKAINIDVDPERMEKLESISVGDTGYYKFMNTDSYSSPKGYNILEVKRDLKRNRIIYSIGRIIEENGEECFDIAFTWTTLGV